MAFTVTARHSGNSTTTSAQTLTTSSATPTASSLFLTFFGAENDSHSTAHAFQTPTGGGYTYSSVSATTSFDWETTSSFAVALAGYRADVGGSPAAHTVTVDAYSTTNAGFYAASCLDITGHASSTPVRTATGGAAVNPSGSSASGTVTLSAAPAANNLVVVGFIAGADSGGGFATPTAGASKTFTSILNQNTGFAQLSTWYRICDGTESATITCSDLGDTVGNYAAVAVEIAATATAGGLITARRGHRGLIMR